MSSISLKVIKAKHGDSLLLCHDDVTLLIDGGPPGVYKRFVQPALSQLKPKNNFTPAQIDLLMVSHIDSDHIAGVLDLTGELIEKEQENAKPLVTINEVWHNSFADTLIKEMNSSAVTVREQSLQVADLGGGDNELAKMIENSSHVLASVSQGRRLRNEVERLKISLNSGFEDSIVLSSSQKNTWQKSGVSIKAIGPTQNELDDLREKWAKELPKILKKDQDKQAALASAGRLDQSISNLASIVAIVQADGKSILLTGDARGDMIHKWLVDRYQKNSFHFDVIKWPHHGSDKNIDSDFFKHITADIHVVCGDGNHGNPEPKTFEMLFNAQPQINYKIVMTYGYDELKQHSDFDKNNEFDAILSKDPKRKACLHYPGKNDTYVEVFK